MRKKLLLSAALTCIAGGLALTSPAFARTSYPDCDTFRGTACTTPGASMTCQWEGRYMDVLYCFNGTWE
ncbi:MAG TPA: hypothetical protein VFQ76_15550 [Longimicrobiaceae bacterium]|nr:hypothetical protein [Longimicrobiaceae bacterium]